MNKGIHLFPRHRPPLALPAIRALCKFDGTAPAGGAGFQIEAPALKLLYNVSKIVYNGTGDYTIHFSEPFETPQFLCFFSARQGAGGRGIVDVNTSDLGRADQKRIDVFNATPTPVNSTEICAVFIQ